MTTLTAMAEKHLPVKEKQLPPVETQPQQEEVTQPEQSDEDLEQEIESARQASKDDYATDDGSIFGSIDSTRKALFEALGIKPLEAQDTRQPKLVNFVDDSDEALAECDLGNDKRTARRRKI